ncbi:MAG: DUF167 family protein [Burkholderiaceae bacterium]
MPDHFPSWLTLAGDDLVLAVHAQPGARRDAIVGEHGGRLKVALTTPPIEGRANQALIKFLAKRLAITRASIDLLSGETSREKRFRIHGLEATDLIERLGH